VAVIASIGGSCDSVVGASLEDDSLEMLVLWTVVVEKEMSEMRGYHGRYLMLFVHEIS
jgi:hypothetical protein